MAQVTCRASALFFARAAGVYSSAPTGHVASESAMAIVLSALLGAAAGLLAGLVLLPIIRYTAYLAGRNISGAPLLILGILAGAAICVWLTLTGKDD